MKTLFLNLKHFIYKAYRSLNHSSFICNSTFLLYNLGQAILNPYCHPSFFYTKKQYSKLNIHISNKSSIKVAFICDEMTYKTFCEECHSVFLTPNNWKKVLKEWKPDFLFCESAWLGIQECKGCWRGKIYKNQTLKFDNRKTLLQILKFCQKNQIKTVFWNKEDPTYFGNQQYDFVSTALLFDYIFTTCQECISEYKRLGHPKVFLLQFAANPLIYNPIHSTKKRNQAVFAGSWYGENKERCKEMRRIFDMVLHLGIELVIFDRNYGTTSFQKQFPEKYQPYVRPAVPFEQLGDIIKQSQYAININTVTESSTMFARRVFELILCNTVIISNPSAGMAAEFPNGIVFTDHSISISELEEAQKWKEKNICLVLKKHLNHNRFYQLCKETGFLRSLSEFPKIAVFYQNEAHAKHQLIRITYPHVDAYIQNSQSCFSIIHEDNTPIIKHEEKIFQPSSYNYFYFCSPQTTEIPAIEELLYHFSYIAHINAFAGIKKGVLKYEFLKTDSYFETLWNISQWEKIEKNKDFLIYSI